MVRVQIQLPEPLARQLKGIAEVRDLSFAELCRRGLERYASQWTELTPAEAETWAFPVLSPHEMNEDQALARQESAAIESRTP